jgi:hypothetical protein
MFARQSRLHAIAFTFALLVTSGMLGAVDSLATHPAAELQMATAPGALQCPAHA